MLKLPLPPTDELQLADWLEFHALSSPDGNASYIDLERVLRREGIIELGDDEAIISIIQNVSFEFDRRAMAAERAYPFKLGDRGISLRGTIERFAAYIFCLCISLIDDKHLDKKPYPRRMFEYLSCEAAKNFVGGNVIRFGSPRHPPDLPKEFHLAVSEVCRYIGEGIQFRGGKTASSKDDGVDVVAWRDFPDQTDGKILLLGNCASGRDWSSKLTELNPHGFCENWLFEIPVSLRSGLIKAFFVPRRIDTNMWKKVSRDAGIVFDRCRIAYWVFANDGFKDKELFWDWIQQVIVKALN